MKKLSLFVLMVCVTGSVRSQTVSDLFRNIRYYNIDGYIILDKDTVKGMICLPIEKDEINYAILRNKVIFQDSAGNKKQYKPKELQAFGLRGGDIEGDYVSYSSEYLSKRFLRKIVAGKLSLLQEITTAPPQHAYSPVTGHMTTIPAPRSADKVRLYYLLQENGEPITIELDGTTSAIRKKDLKKISGLVPLLAKNEGDVFIHDLVKALNEVNAGK
jgi:hypothetical protein